VVRDGETGLLVDPGDARAFAEALEALADRPDREGMGARARDLVRARYDMSAMVTAYETLYAEILRLA